MSWMGSHVPYSPRFKRQTQENRESRQGDVSYALLASQALRYDYPVAVRVVGGYHRMSGRLTLA
jgi:hypothetical protein